MWAEVPVSPAVARDGTERRSIRETEFCHGVRFVLSLYKVNNTFHPIISQATTSGFETNSEDFSVSLRTHDQSLVQCKSRGLQSGSRFCAEKSPSLIFPEHCQIPEPFWKGFQSFQLFQTENPGSSLFFAELCIVRTNLRREAEYHSRLELVGRWVFGDASDQSQVEQLSGSGLDGPCIGPIETGILQSKTNLSCPNFSQWMKVEKNVPEEQKQKDSEKQRYLTCLPLTLVICSNFFLCDSMSTSLSSSSVKCVQRTTLQCFGNFRINWDAEQHQNKCDLPSSSDSARCWLASSSEFRCVLLNME